MRLTFVRHCEVDERYKNCYNGHNDIGLSKSGEMCAKELAKKLDALEFDAVFCSDLRRAKDSIKDSLHTKNIIYTNRLREKSWGVHEGMSYEEIVAKEGCEYKDFLQWINLLGGESYEEFITRVEEFFLEFLLSLQKENILIVTHAGVIRTLICILDKISLEEAFSIKVECGSIITKRIENQNI